MASTKEIKDRINSVRETRKITNAMYLIASTKLRKAKLELTNTRPYFEALRGEVNRAFRTVEDVDTPYFYPADDDTPREGTYGCLVITADKGLAGSYNMNVIKKAEQMLEKHPDTKLFVVGEYGRHFFDHHSIPIEQSFLYTAQNPTLDRAREISERLLDGFLSGELQEIYVIYTDMESSLLSEAKVTRLLPLHRSLFRRGRQRRGLRPVRVLPVGVGGSQQRHAQLHRGLCLQRPGRQLLLRAECAHERHGLRQPERREAAGGPVPPI